MVSVRPECRISIIKWISTREDGMNNRQIGSENSLIAGALQVLPVASVPSDWKTVYGT